MLGSGVIGFTQHRLERVWSSRLSVPLRPASSGPLRHWQDQVRLAVKGAIAAVGAWALAKYAIGQPDPYFAPLAALLGVYPTVARSLREGVQYVAGFLLGAALAIPVGVVLGPGIAGIAVVVIAGVLVSGWDRLGDQSAQVTLTALFALLLGGHQPVSYISHRLVDVGIGVATGLAVNVLLFPPLQLRPAEHAVRQWGDVIASALEDLSAVAADPDSGMRSWSRHDRQLTAAAEQARSSARHARESMRWNLRAKVERAVPRPDGTVLDSLEELTARTRAVARSLPDIGAADGAGPNLASFGQDYAVTLRNLADPVRQLADLRSSRPGTELTAASHGQHQLERQTAQLPGHSAARSTAQHLVRLTSEIISEVAEHQADRKAVSSRDNQRIPG
jgi:uncharacterized membrane protein YgaE (UPF0421/DUF939 family)